MIEVKSIKVYAEGFQFPIAYMLDGSGWHDPHGGEFSDTNKLHLDRVLCGETQSIHLERYYGNLRVVVELNKE